MDWWFDGFRSQLQVIRLGIFYVLGLISTLARSQAHKAGFYKHLSTK
jgi:hypothetical protein